MAVKKKIYPPTMQYPHVDFAALVRRERSRLQGEGNCVIKICGRGGDDPEAKEDEMLHILILAEKEEFGHKSEQLVRDLILDPERLGKPVEKNEAIIRHEYGRLVGGDIKTAVQYEESEMKVPNHLAGGIIGRQGEQVKLFQQQSGARISLSKDSDPDGGNMRTILIRGLPGQIRAATELIEEWIRDRQQQVAGQGLGNPMARAISAAGFDDPNTPRDAFGHDAITESLAIPLNRVGTLVARGGVTILEIQSMSDTKITIAGQAPYDNPNVRVLEILGRTPRAIDLAKAEIEAIVQGPGGMAEPQNMGTYKVPNDKAGLIIGRGGATIKMIQDKSRARLQIPAMADPGSMPPMRTVQIMGTPEAIQLAIAEMEAVMVGHQQRHHYNRGAHWENRQPELQQSSNQPDYTAQWAEYYRQLEQLDPEAKRVAMEQAQQVLAQQAQPQAQATEQNMTPEQWAQWQAYYASIGQAQQPRPQ